MLLTLASHRPDDLEAVYLLVTQALSRLLYRALHEQTRERNSRPEFVMIGYLRVMKNRRA